MTYSITIYLIDLTEFYISYATFHTYVRVYARVRYWAVLRCISNGSIASISIANGRRVNNNKPDQQTWSENMLISVVMKSWTNARVCKHRNEYLIKKVEKRAKKIMQ